MDKRTADALELSIAHWERNVAAETPEEAATKGEYCALCDVFYYRMEKCSGCPVSAWTGRTTCAGSPYAAADIAYYSWLGSPDSADHLAAWRAAAQRELNFLKGLRVEEK